MNDKVIALGCSTGGLALIRALGKRGFHVIALSHDADDIGMVSKHADEVVVCPHPRMLAEFRDFMIARASTWSGSLIIESGDYYAQALSRLHDDLSDHYRLMTPEWDKLSLFVDKEKAYKLAESCGVPYPKTFYPDSIAMLTALREEITLPCIIKPVRSHEFVARFNKKLFVVHTFEELVAKYSLCVEAEQTVIVQEIVPGDDRTFERVHLYLNSRGEVGAEIHHKTTRLSPPGYGVMRAGFTVPPNQEVRDLALRLLTSAGYQGVAGFQFKRNRDTNELVFIEVNGRVPRSVQIDIAAGVDLPWIIYQDIVKDVQLPSPSYEETVWIEFWPDVLNAILNDDKAEFSLREFVKPYLAHRKTFAVLSMSDPKPMLKQTAMLPAIGRRKFARGKRRKVT